MFVNSVLMLPASAPIATVVASPMRAASNAYSIEILTFGFLNET